MTSKPKHWTKLELQMYILLLCANADNMETEIELEIIKSKVDSKTFEKMYSEFSKDSEDQRFEKIDDSIHYHDYNNRELIKFRQEVHEVFFSDGKLNLMEQNLNRILNNILY